jgi:hypothetical protein
VRKRKRKKEFASLIIRRLEGGLLRTMHRSRKFSRNKFSHNFKTKTEIKNGALIFREKTVKDKKSFLEETITFGQNLFSHNNAMKLNYSCQTLL